ncbi:hypothetical protein F6X40_17125 [Paraburkholderia sp. UCT31]|uniref:hypothetical protein n=1 Tax=Paraburkholderia sp. UCT31 TaxID=2615209 RepID=UPI001655CCE8|nr:hypothetical protein [Paraburkholderia sp. UCT31]MBC8738498.1 hypothetical protein [Paraburkholderia sp. UCT31]
MKLPPSTEDFHQWVENANSWRTRFLRRFEPKIANAFAAKLAALARFGWYIPGEDFAAEWFWAAGAEAVALEKAARFDDAEEVDRYMSSAVQHYLKTLEDELLAAAPARAKLIKQTFCAYELQMFSLAIMGFVAIAEGLVVSQTGLSFHGAEGRELKKHLMAKSPFPNEVQLLAPLFSNMAAMTLSRGQREQRPAGLPRLSRNEVMHALVEDYDSGLSALKTECYAAYVVRVCLPVIRKYSDGEKWGAC